MTIHPAPKPGKKSKSAKKKKRFAVKFGGKEYVEFIKSLPCAICGVRGFTVAAHLTSRGAGGKAKDIAPLCCFRGAWSGRQLVAVVNGCHERYDDHDPAIRVHEGRLRELADELQSTHLLRKSA